MVSTMSPASTYHQMVIGRQLIPCLYPKIYDRRSDEMTTKTMSTLWCLVFWCHMHWWTPECSYMVFVMDTEVQ